MQLHKFIIQRPLGLPSRDFQLRHSIIPTSFIRGDVCAIVQRIILHLKIKQMVPASIPPQLVGEWVRGQGPRWKSFIPLPFETLQSQRERQKKLTCRPESTRECSLACTYVRFWWVSRVCGTFLPCGTSLMIFHMGEKFYEPLKLIRSVRACKQSGFWHT